MADTLALELIGRASDLEGIRLSQYQSTWQQISGYFLPNQSVANTQKLPGSVSSWTQDVYNSVAIQAAQILAAGSLNWLTPANELWAEYNPPEYLSAEGREQDLDDAQQWLSNATNVTMRELARSNFYAKIIIDYLQVAVFGTGMMFAEEGKKTSLNFRQFQCWSFVMEEDDEGIVDTVHRKFELTTRQAVQMFGLDNVGDKINKAYTDKNAKQLSKKWEFQHSCFPRQDSDRIPGRQDGANKPYASVYISLEDNLCVEISGYDEMPYLCSRFASWGMETPWGYSPAYLTLMDARQLNYIAQYRDAFAELRAYPRLLYPSNLDGDVDLRAGGVTVYDETVNDGKPEEWMTQGDDKQAAENMAEHADAINKAFHVETFNMLGSEPLQDKDMTAYEVSQRLGEKLNLFTPVFYRRVSEFMNPLLKRVFGILFRAGKFGKPPQALLVPTADGKGASLALPEIAITSRISLALKAVQNAGMVNTIQTLLPLSESQPQIMDNFDLDIWARDIARNNGVPPSALASMKSMAAVRAQRAAQQQAQQAAELAERMGGTMADLGKAPKQLQDAVVHQFAG